MGKVRFGIPQDLALKLRDAYGLKYFVETGTYKAGTASWASGEFEHVWTIEGYEPFYLRNMAAHSDKANLTMMLGDSRKMLPAALELFDGPALIWLDAHWLGNTILSAGTDGECPLVEEIAAIHASGRQHFVLIDDAHCFQGSLPAESDRSLWPNMTQVKAMLKGYDVRVHEDVIIAVPPHAARMIDEYVRKPELAILVLTSNEYVHVLSGFAYLFNKYWSSNQFVTVLRYDKRPPYLPPNFYAPAAGRQSELSFTGGLRSWLENVYFADQLILMLEDYYLSRPVDIGGVMGLWTYLRSHPEVSKIDLSGDLLNCGSAAPYAPGLVQAAPDYRYRGSLQAAIWRRDYLLEACAVDLDPWQFERRVCKTGLILGTDKPPMAYVNAVGGAGKRPGEYDRKKIPEWMWNELRGKGLVS